MKILVIGGTRFFGIHTVNQLLRDGHDVTIATRGRTGDDFGDKIKRLTFDRYDEASIRQVLGGKYFDLVIDKIAYCSNDIKKLLDIIDFGKFIYMSTTAIYESKHLNMTESDFNPLTQKLVWCDRKDFPYDEVKRQAEIALWQKYSNRKFIAVRYPVVLGKDDYTKRLEFYIQHVMNDLPMNIDNLDAQMSFICSEEAGAFMAFLADKDFCGTVNGASSGTISLREIIDYIEKKSGKKAIIKKDGDSAPYNGEVSFSVKTEKAREIGFHFSDLHEWIFDLIDWYIANYSF